MPQKKHKPEEIVAKLRQVDVLVSQGQSVAEAVRSIGIGLGLPIARAILRAHGGDVVLSNRPEGGLSARITRPLAHQ